MGDTAPKRGPDPVYDAIGDVGKYQLLLLALICLSKFPVGWHQLSIIFLAPAVNATCINSTPEKPIDLCDEECEVEYDRSVFTETMITEFNLICEKKNYAKLSQSLFMLGILIGNMSYGIWADKMGRKKTFLCSIVLQLVAGVGASVAIDFYSFAILRFILAIATGGSMLISFCLLMEIIGPAHRELLLGTIYQLPFNLGHLMLAVVGYFIRNFRWYQFTLSIYSVILLSYFCLVPESPRWLIVNQRPDEAIEILEYAAKVNKRPPEKVRGFVEEAVRLQASKPAVKKAKVSDLLRTPNLRKYTIVILYGWFTVGFNYFGISQYVGNLGGHIFTNVFISALLTIPGVFLSTPAGKYLGRKGALMLSNTIITICMGLMVIVPDEYVQVEVVLAAFGVLGAALLFPVIYIYSGEIFPTVARNSGMGLASMIARVGAMLAAHASNLNTYGTWAPPLTFSLISFVSVLLTFLVPETIGQPLPETLDDAENRERKTK